jgi:adenylate cyclase
MREKRQMSVGFADLAHYARMVDLLGSEGALDVLQQALEDAGGAIVRHGGQIRKYIGDAILFSFEDPRSAARAAAEIAGGFRRDIGPLVVRYRVAVATGEVLLCELGHSSHRVQDIMGHTVNAAARLVKEAHRSESGVALCEETQRLGAGDP